MFAAQEQPQIRFCINCSLETRLELRTQTLKRFDARSQHHRAIPEAHGYLLFAIQPRQGGRSLSKNSTRPSRFLSGTRTTTDPFFKGPELLSKRRSRGKGRILFGLPLLRLRVLILTLRVDVVAVDTGDAGPLSIASDAESTLGALWFSVATHSYRFTLHFAPTDFEFYFRDPILFPSGNFARCRISQDSFSLQIASLNGLFMPRLPALDGPPPISPTRRATKIEFQRKYQDRGIPYWRCRPVV
ncbi:hypothetical protein B0H14DRAFT_2634969 [Mycena olivaceomarginata]|nr:hypothetical protein B0H14DRAFT_2634969 [Mycena olivaceomarginata]